QSRRGLSNIVLGLARPRTALFIDVFLWDQAALLQLVEQEPAIGRQRAVEFVLPQQIQAGPLEPASLGLRPRQQSFVRHDVAPLSALRPLSVVTGPSCSIEISL